MKPDKDKLKGREFLDLDKELMNKNIKEDYKEKDVYLIWYNMKEEKKYTNQLDKLMI